MHGESDVHCHPHTPTPSSSAAVEAVASTGSPSTPHFIIPTKKAGTLQDTSAVFLPQSLSELVGPSPQLSPPPPPSSALFSSFQLTAVGDKPCKPFLCLWDSCQQEFPSLLSLVTHLDRAHTLAMTQFVCLWENCSRKLKPFDARYKLITHLRCHTGEKPYQCDVVSCKRSFSRLENLKLHTRTHTGEKPYQCDYAGCTKKFNNTSDRAKHKKTHVTRKPYACRYPGCGKSYTDPSSMRKHIKYTHKLKEESERAGLSLLPLPKRKRSSASSSSSSSSSSSGTPQTPQQSSIIAHSPQVTGALHEPAAGLLQRTPIAANSHRNGILGGSATSSQAQLIPMVKIGGKVQATQPVLLPTYQQPPVMMLLANSTTPATNWVTVSSSSPVQWTPTTTSLVQHSDDTKQDKSSYTDQEQSLPSIVTVEDQLRLQIAHLKQQLYQSQLVAARANQTPQLLATSQAPGNLQTLATDKTESMENGIAEQLQGKMVVTQSLQLQKVMKQEHSLPVLNNGPGEQGSLTSDRSMALPTSAAVPRQALQLAAVSERPPQSISSKQLPIFSSTAPVEVGSTSQTIQVPQYIPIPILQSPEISATQYLYMSP